MLEYYVTRDYIVFLMRRVILFRFHKDPEVCKNRVAILNKFNPGVSIFGLYGGLPADLSLFRKVICPEVENIFDLSYKGSRWNWKNGDLAIRLWYKEVGNNVSFEMLHVVEWDMLFLEPLAKLYDNIPSDSVGLTGLVPLSKVSRSWDWVRDEPYKSQWEEQLRFVKKRYNYASRPFACVFGGCCISREFLEQYVNTDVLEVCHDELRLPLYAQILNIDLYNTKLANVWSRSLNQRGYFNAIHNSRVGLPLIMRELGKPRGRRVFHPYRRMFDISIL